MAASRVSSRGLRLPARALKVLGLPAHASLDEARGAHRAMAFQLHPDLTNSRHDAEESARRRSEQLVMANSAREAIEFAARQAAGQTEWTMDARRQWDASTKKIHFSALFGHWEEVLEALALGVDPNVLTPAQGAPPIFYASCWDKLGGAHLGYGDEGRLRVLEVLASNLKIDMSLEGRAMWAQGHTITDLVSMGRRSLEAIDILIRNQEARIAMFAQSGTFFAE
mmetsp:Transcript_56529/g.112395  ORF Transcript_56529/g.112395 Transcript_56529/m.112395 type:complete len:225 (+) Transcript_56529:69-743(+)